MTARTFSMSWMRTVPLWAASLLCALAGRASAQATPTPRPFSFGEPRFYAAGTEPVAVTVGQFSADSFLDIAVVNYGADSVMQFNNDGTGRFNRYGPEIRIGSEESPTYPTWIASLRKNPNADVTDSMIFVRDPTDAELNSQDFEFWGRATTLRAGLTLRGNETIGEGPVFVRAGVDLNADGAPDAVVVNSYDDTLTFLLNRPVLDTYNVQTIFTLTSPVGVAFGDFTGDGLPDIAAVSDSGELLVHRNLGGMPLVAPRFLNCEFLSGPGCEPMDVALEPSAVESLQVDGDNKLDLAIADPGTATVVVLRGNGDGTFKTPEPYATADAPGAIAVADFNGDGYMDIAVTLPDVDQVQVLRGRADGTFDTTLAPFPAGPSPSSLVAADFNKDGRMDLASASDTSDAIIVLLNGVSPPVFTPTITRTPSVTLTPTITRTPTKTSTVTRTPTTTRTLTVTPTATRTATLAATATRTRTMCPGDCDGDGSITGQDLGRVTQVLNRCPMCADGGATASGCAGTEGCPAGDIDHDGCLSAGEFARMTSRAASGGTCP